MTHVIAFAEEMTRAAVDWQLVIYGEAMHGVFKLVTPFSEVRWRFPWFQLVRLVRCVAGGRAA